MIKKLEISGQHIEVTKELQRYISRKIGLLDRYVPRHARQSMHAEVKLKESKSKDKRQYTCEVILHVPGEVLTCSEKTIAMFASIDIIEEKLKMQLKKYKEKHTDPKLYRRLFARVNRSLTQNVM